MSPAGGSLTAMRRAVLKRFATRRFEPVPPRLPASERFQDCFSLYPGPTEALRLETLSSIGGESNGPTPAKRFGFPSYLAGPAARAIGGGSALFSAAQAHFPTAAKATKRFTASAHFDEALRFGRSFLPKEALPLLDSIRSASPLDCWNEALQRSERHRRAATASAGAGPFISISPAECCCAAGSCRGVAIH